MKHFRMPTPFVLFTGGKGGVGKTACAANLGVHMAREGQRVLLVDLDLGLANLNVLLRLTTQHSLEDALAGRVRLADCIVLGPEGVHVLPAGSGTGDMAREDTERRTRLLEGIAEVAEDYDYVIADSGAGIGPDVLAFAACADLVLIVTTPDPTALTDAYGLVKALDAHAIEGDIEVPTPDLFINLVDGVDEARDTARKLRLVCERFLARSPRLAGWLPRSRVIRAACGRQHAFATGDRNSLEHSCVRRLAERVARQFPGRRPALSGLKG